MIFQNLSHWVSFGKQLLLIPAGFSLVKVKVKIWILNTENHQVSEFSMICGIFSLSGSSGSIHATYSHIHSLNKDLLSSSVQELCVVGCRCPEGIMVFPDLHQLTAYCGNRHANSYSVTSGLTTEQVLGIMGAEAEAWTSAGGNSGESKRVSLAFQEKNDTWRTNRCWAREEV